MDIYLTMEDVNPIVIQKMITKFTSSEYFNKSQISLDYYKNRNTNISKRKIVMAVPEKRIDPKTNEEYTHYAMIEDLSKANNKITHSYHNSLVSQCTNYLAGKPVQISYPEDMTEEEIEEYNEVLFKDNDWTIFNQVNVKNTQIFAKAWFRPVKDKEGKIKLVTYDPREIIPFYDDYGEINLIIRFYERVTINADGDEVKVGYAEVYDNKEKKVWVKRQGDENYVYDEELSGGLMTLTNVYGDTEVEKELIELPFVPIIEWKMNYESMNAFEPIKPFVDAVNLNISDWANNVEDIQDAIWVLKNYDGQDLAEFMHDIQVKKAVKVGDGGDLESKTLDIPVQARKELYEALDKNIYKFGMGVDFTDRQNMGNASGVALKQSYINLDQKADSIDSFGQGALTRLHKLILLLMGKDYEGIDIECNFDRTMVVNEQETTSTTLSKLGTISDQTIIEELGYDYEQEKERLEGEYEINDDAVTDEDFEELYGEPVENDKLEKEKGKNDKGGVKEEEVKVI